MAWVNKPRAELIYYHVKNSVAASNDHRMIAYDRIQLSPSGSCIIIRNTEPGSGYKYVPIPKGDTLQVALRLEATIKLML